MGVEGWKKRGRERATKVLLALHSLWGVYTVHTIYTGNNMGQKCEGKCGLWVLNEILKKTYAENLKKIVGAVWELPVK